jgi:hypothetical protein
LLLNPSYCTRQSHDAQSAAPHRQREVEMGTISIIVVAILLPNGGGG